MVSLGFGTRIYAPDIARFWQHDPMLHNYHWIEIEEAIFDLFGK